MNKTLGDTDSKLEESTLDYSHFEESSLFTYSKDEIAEHYANLATSVIVCFSSEFKTEEWVQCLNKILDLLEQDKDEIINRKKKMIADDKAAKENWERNFAGSKESRQKVKEDYVAVRKKREEEEL